MTGRRERSERLARRQRRREPEVGDAGKSRGREPHPTDGFCQRAGMPSADDGAKLSTRASERVPASLLHQLRAMSRAALFLLVDVFVLLTACTSPGRNSVPEAMHDASLRQTVDKVDNAARHVQEAIEGRPLRVRALETRRVGAWCFPDGRIYISRPFACAAGEAELAAAIAHECGHLLIDHHMPAPAGLTHLRFGFDDVEHEADTVGVHLLRTTRYGPEAIPRMLRLVASLHPTAHAERTTLLRRAELLEAGGQPAQYPAAST